MDIMENRKLRYISLFSGIEAVSVALDGGPWEPVAFCEIDGFPSEVLAYHWPDVPNLGDITKVDWTPYVDKVDVVFGGSPCTSFSTAGKREGLKGESGLMFEYIRCVREVRPRWFVWENVPGALSSEHGGAFRQLLSEMDALGYGLAWRVLDAQFFGVAQRRERLFLVGSLGTMRSSEVLFEREGMPWDYSSSRDKRKALAGESSRRSGESDSGPGGRGEGGAADDGGCLTTGENQSQRDEVRLMDVPGALSAQSGSKQQSYVALDFHQQDGRAKVSDTPDVSMTITAHAGTGGNNVPMVMSDSVQPPPVGRMMCRGGSQTNAGVMEEMSPTLTETTSRRSK